MGEKIIIYYYTECLPSGLFSEKIRPAVISEATSAFRELSLLCFKDCGGLKVVDYYKNDNTHVRISFWRSKDGYRQWIEHEKNKNYLAARKAYQKQNQIVELLEGPFEGVIYA